MRKISLCIPTFERVEMTIESFQDVYFDERISEIVIVDDCSSTDAYQRLKAITSCMEKVRLIRNPYNIDCYRNKAAAVQEAKEEFGIVLDSDNKISTAYLDMIYQYQWSKDTILQPTFAQPQFDFTPFSGLYLTSKNVSEYIHQHMFTTALNAMNYFVHLGEYMRVWRGDIDPHTADSIYQAMCWLEAGNQFYFVPGLSYYHRVHAGSHYQNNRHKTGNTYLEIENKLKQMS